MRERSAFTLIELLIVVLIIAILAAIAVPNFLEFQTRAKVARVVSDMRNVSIGLEAYYVDNDEYPAYVYRTDGSKSGWLFQLKELSTPIAYMTNTNLDDPFGPPGGFQPDNNPEHDDYTYVNVDLARIRAGRPLEAVRPKWFLVSLGPDFIRGPQPFTGASWSIVDYAIQPAFRSDYTFKYWDYDPTNGTVSTGDIKRFGP